MPVIIEAFVVNIIEVCIESLGCEFVNWHKDTACDGYADLDDHA